ncbi:MAG TPA: ATP-binding cassette domain-containing protein [Burkholderiales bacterium]|nr:ATP-binding cassette domain-containing protein [Burkholderiales bacterium]
MPLLTLAGAELAYGDLPLLDRASFAMEGGERIGLIGRNGTGKSSLLGVIAGAVHLDDGELRKRDGLVISMVEQEPVLPPAPTLRESLLLRSPVPQPHKLDEFMDRFQVNPLASPQSASGGESKRAALALAFALEPDLLLLDEPTNHLDVQSIELLETWVARQPAAIVVTHDRAFLDRVATRILELDRGQLFSYEGNYSRYETLKAGQLAAEAVTQRKFDKFWAQEEAWIRKGIEARRTRNEGRVRRLEHLRAERASRRARLGSVKLSLGAGERSGKLVCELTQVTKSFDGRAIVRDLDLIVSRGDRLGLIGPNGAGKTTLLRLILGTLAPDSGSVRLGTNVHPAYFDQMRAALDPDKTVAETISLGSEWVEVADGKKHVMSYLGDFLFPPRRATSPVRMLSGGERNRLLLARLFARPANVLVLDEPTNDLDIESLELLEAALQDYAGTLLLVSHDRAFLDNVVTQTIAAEGAGVWKEYAGGYSDYLRQRPVAGLESNEKKASPGREKSRVKLSYKETRELEALPTEIEALELEQKNLFEKMHAPDYYRQPPDALRADQQRSAEIDATLLQKLERWEILESKIS